MTAERFTAWAMCPSCGLVDCHKMRPPKPAPTAEEIAAWEEIVRIFEISCWGIGVVDRIEDPPRPVDESVYEVIRTCRCGKEWGQL